jgi:Domain of unknown function (DUF1707)
MTTDRWMRASDQDRDNATEVLSEAYAVGRLGRHELDERTLAAFSARTWGELRDLTADLPAATAGAGLPTGIVASRGTPRRDSWRFIGQMSWIFVLVLAAGLAALVIPAEVWLAAVLVPLELLLVHALGISRRYLCQRKRGGSDMADELRLSTSLYDIKCICSTCAPVIPEGDRHEAIQADHRDPGRRDGDRVAPGAPAGPGGPGQFGVTRQLSPSPAWLAPSAGHPQRDGLSWVHGGADSRRIAILPTVPLMQSAGVALRSPDGRRIRCR